MTSPAPAVEQVAPTIEGPPACFECEQHPATFEVTVMEQTSMGSRLGKAWPICEACVGPSAAALPDDLVVLITRLPKDPS